MTIAYMMELLQGMCFTYIKDSSTLVGNTITLVLLANIYHTFFFLWL